MSLSNRCLALLALSTTLAVAHADPIATDRPDVVESSDVVGPGRVQIETSIARSRDRTNGIRSTLSATPTLFRFGVSEHVELRVETEGRLRAWDSATGQRTRGSSDVEVGLKWHFQDGDEESGRASQALLVHAVGARGSAAFAGEGRRPSLRWVLEWELPQGWALGVMPGIFQDRNAEGRRYTAGVLAAVVSRELNDAWRVFGEVAAEQIASSRHGGKVASLNFGTAYLLSPDWQIDAAISRGITRQTPDWSWTIGLSTRF